MINGNSVIAQIGEETTYGTGVTPTKQFKISSESLKPVYNKIDEGLATGGRGSGLQATMGIGIEGAMSTLFRADMGYLLKGALGVETVAAAGDSEVAKKHTYTCIASGETNHLPSFSAVVDRKVGKFRYTGLKFNNLTLSASSGDYLKCDFDLVGKSEETNATVPALTPSTLKAFKFAQGKVYNGDTEIADVTSMSVSIANNLDYQTQTTATGDYYKEPEVGTRNITCELEAIYGAGVEALRNTYYKSDATLSVKLEFISDENADTDIPYSLTITLPCCQMSDATANMGGLDTLRQTMSLNVVDNLTDELIVAELINKAA